MRRPINERSGAKGYAEFSINTSPLNLSARAKAASAHSEVAQQTGRLGYFMLRFGFAPASLILGSIIEENFSKANTASSTPYSTKFRVPYGIALGLVKGVAGLAEFTPETIADPELSAIAAKVRYRIDPDDP